MTFPCSFDCCCLQGGGQDLVRNVALTNEPMPELLELLDTDTTATSADSFDSSNDSGNTMPVRKTPSAYDETPGEPIRPSRAARIKPQSATQQQTLSGEPYTILEGKKLSICIFQRHSSAKRD